MHKSDRLIGCIWIDFGFFERSRGFTVMLVFEGLKNGNVSIVF